MLYSLDAIPAPSTHSRESGNPERRATANLDFPVPPSKLGQIRYSLWTYNLACHAWITTVAGRSSLPQPYAASSIVKVHSTFVITALMLTVLPGRKKRVTN